MSLDSKFLWNILFLLNSFKVSEIESITFLDCTKTIKQTVIDENNGTLQFEYAHYPGFWLSQTLRQKEQSIAFNIQPKEEEFDKSSDFVTIMDIEANPNLSDVENRHLWSWKVTGTFSQQWIYTKT